MSDFKFEADVSVRFADVDVLHHVNHAAYFTLVEEARLVYFGEVMGLAMPEDLKSWVLAEIKCKYLQPLRYGDRTTIRIRVTWMRRSSFGAEFEIRCERSDQPMATGELVQVYVSTETGRAAPIPDDLRKIISDYESIPLQAV